MLDLRSGGWLVLLAVALVALLIWWMVVPVLRSSSKAVGDGRNVASYGFDLSSFDLPRGQLVSAGFPKDGMPSLDDPAVMPGDEVAELNEKHRGKYLVSDDRVIGVAVAGEARAYPLRVLNWHEVVNDTLGGVPIAVTYHPLCDSVVVFDRRVGEEVLELGVSGLLWNSNLLMFDRRAGGKRESLWSQLLARAVAGPAAGGGRATRLRVLPSSVAHWGDWRERHPGTTVVAPDPDLLKRYQRDPYGNYLMTGQLRFPVEPMPPGDPAELMTPVVVLESGHGPRLYRLKECATGGAEQGYCDDERRVRVTRGEKSYSVLVDAPPDVGVYHALWFAWWAGHPQP
jgi:hypothetical protein